MQNKIICLHRTLYDNIYWGFKGKCYSVHTAKPVIRDIFRKRKMWSFNIGGILAKFRNISIALAWELSIKIHTHRLFAEHRWSLRNV